MSRTRSSAPCCYSSDDEISSDGSLSPNTIDEFGLDELDVLKFEAKKRFEAKKKPPNTTEESEEESDDFEKMEQLQYEANKMRIEGKTGNLKTFLTSKILSYIKAMSADNKAIVQKMSDEISPEEMEAYIIRHPHNWLCSRERYVT